MFDVILRVVVGLAIGIAIYLMGASLLRKFWVAPPAEPDPDLVVPVDLKFRCGVCGAEVVMTAAQADTEIDAPRHCREDMILVSD